MKGRQCIICGAPAQLWCDYPLGWTRDLERMRERAPLQVSAPANAVRLKYRIQHTCDADLCYQCANPRGHWHARLGSGRAVGDTVDFCPGHEGEGRRMVETTLLQVLEFRARWRKVARLRQVGDQLDLLEGVQP